jgi:biopolymer transport protein ExbB/TolQ
MSAWHAFLAWWSGGDLLMPVMLVVALVLYGCIGERLWALFGPASHREGRRDELLRLVEADHHGERDTRYRAWVAQYVAAAEQDELSRGFTLMRVLTACLPLLGLLGTVSGMVDTFSALGQGRGGGTAQQASAGIGLALTATQYGMALAIPAVVAEWLLRRRVDALVEHREAVTRGLVAGRAG